MNKSSKFPESLHTSQPSRVGWASRPPGQASRLVLTNVGRTYLDAAAPLTFVDPRGTRGSAGGTPTLPGAARGPICSGLALCLLLTLVFPAFAETNYEVVPNWPALPSDHKLGLCAGVGVDSHNDVFVFHRNGRAWSTPFPEEPLGGPAVSVFEGSSGKLLGEWGAGEFVMPHGLTLDRDDNVWLTDVARQQVFKYTHDGRLLMTLGERGVPGADQAHFNLPTDVAVLPDGSFYVSDGYRNTRVVKFDAAGHYEFEWGGKGQEAGHFNLPHGIAVDAGGRVYVCDRSNARLQVFDPRGLFLAAWEGAAIGRPYGVSIGPGGHIFLIDGGDQSTTHLNSAKVVELDPAGKVVDSFGSYGHEPGQFETGHDIAVAPDGSIYVAEGKGARVQKFRRKTP